MKDCLNKYCKQINPQILDEFSKNKKEEDGLQRHCKECNKEYLEEYYKNNKEIIKNRSKEWRQINKDKKKEYDSDPQNKARARKLMLLRNYNLTTEQYNKILIEQNHKCKICEIDELKARKKRIICRS